MISISLSDLKPSSHQKAYSSSLFIHDLAETASIAICGHKFGAAKHERNRHTLFFVLPKENIK